MNTNDILPLAERIVGFVVNLAVCAVSASYYFQTRRRCLGLISLSAGAALLLYLFPMSWGTVGTFVLSLADLLLWLVGCFILLGEYRDLLATQPGAPPNGGPATRFGDSSTTGGPPSLS